MTALSPIPPDTFKTLLVKYGFRVVSESEYNWTLIKQDASRPVITLPKKGRLLSVEIMMGILDQLKIDNGTYFALLKQIES